MKDQLIGIKLSKITVISNDENYFKYKKYICLCECGLVFSIYKHQITGKKKIKSCRKCSHINSIGKRTGKESKQFIHGMVNTPEYIAWEGMKSRCYNKNNKKYHAYGSRGIIVCDSWLGKNGFNNFIKDMGKKPSSEFSLDRINVNGNYEPNNCRWATQKTQQNNRRNNRIISIDGIIKTVSEWSLISGIPTKILRQRIDRDKKIKKEDIFKPIASNKK